MIQPCKKDELKGFMYLEPEVIDFDNLTDLHINGRSTIQFYEDILNNELVKKWIDNWNKRPAVFLVTEKYLKDAEAIRHAICECLDTKSKRTVGYVKDGKLIVKEFTSFMDANKAYLQCLRCKVPTFILSGNIAGCMTLWFIGIAEAEKQGIKLVYCREDEVYYNEDANVGTLSDNYGTSIHFSCSLYGKGFYIK